MAPAQAPSSGAGEGRTAAPDSLYELLWQVTAYTHLLNEAALADTPLTVSSSGMLLTVADQPGTTVAEISRRIPKTQQTISQVVARLEKLGLIERRLGTGRGVGLHLTDQGHEMAQTARAHGRQLADGLRELLGAERADALTVLLGESRELLAQAADDSA
ncbi:MAG TPA: MarR family winged helix-turn-helix transcriptional regulator [Actinomycetospora sp.]|jgi:DNA-binding MarR family transcriptional regulator|uniref:MarR family winged helix-turn-helix transcriptional regulator n=1 Tax=Actinomycetospora sp. TaxID=1872135 RepID=UPI002F3F4339